MTRCADLVNRALTLGFVLLSIVAPVAAQQPALTGFDDFVSQALQGFKCPGAAVAVVQNGKIVLAKGYGFRDAEAHLPVTTQTVFPIASISKSFTVTTLGTLIDEGKLDWDKPVRDYLPGFRMYDSVATDQITPRDLVTHRSGLPRHDMLWYSSNFTRRELVEKLRYLEPSKPLRQTFQYNNLMFITAGYLAGEVNHTTWEQAVTDRVLKPIGMSSTVFSSAEARKGSDVAQPYRKNRKTEEVSKIPFADWGDIGPAGAINSNIDDLSHYLLFHMNKGSLNGKQLLSANNAAQMQTPQMVIQGTPHYAELGETAYGMGLFLSTYRGHKMAEHGGNLDGFSLNLAFLPNEQIGVVVLTNLDESALPSVIAYNVFDRLLGAAPLPWVDRMLNQEKKARQAELAAETSGFTGQKHGTHPSHDLKDFTGEFAHPAYGLVTIAPSSKPDELAFTINRLNRPLRHFHYDTFAVPANPVDDLEKLKVTFNTDANGDIDSVSLPLESQVKPIVFIRVAEKRMFERTFLEPFTGEYDRPGSPLTVALQGDNHLVASLPGSPVLSLTPLHGTTFAIDTRPGQSLEFKPDSVVYYTPDSVDVFKRK